jgi:predicted transcriptional regulator
MGEPLVTLRPDLAADLDGLAERLGRSRTELTEEAVSDYLAFQRWKDRMVQAAQDELDAGAPARDAAEVFAELDARLEERIAAAGRG